MKTHYLSDLLSWGFGVVAHGRCLDGKYVLKLKLQTQTSYLINIRKPQTRKVLEAFRL